jgi:C4-dicarboxylate-specific signal transduction histidine kinase
VSALASEVYTTGLLTGDAIAVTIAHEVKQPLSGMITNAHAGLRWLDHSTPNLDKAKAAFEQIVADGHRAAAVIESIRAIFSNDARSRNSLDVNEMIGESNPTISRLVRGSESTDVAERS